MYIYIYVYIYIYMNDIYIYIYIYGNMYAYRYIHMWCDSGLAAHWFCLIIMIWQTFFDVVGSFLPLGRHTWWNQGGCAGLLSASGCLKKINKNRECIYIYIWKYVCI